MKKILLITPEYTPTTGGIATYSMALVKSLEDKGYTMKVVVTGDDTLHSEITSVPFEIFKSFYPVKAIVRLWRLHCSIKSFRPDVIITTGTFPLMAGWIFTCIVQSAVFVNILHGNELRKPIRKITSYMLQRYTHLVAVSEFTKSLISNKNAKERCKVIPNGILANWFIEKKTKDSSEKKNFLTVGTIRPRKGHLYFIQAIPELLKVFPDLSYVLCGKPDFPTYLLELKRHSEQLGVNQHVLFESVPYEELEQLKKLYDDTLIYILLSQNQSNGDTEGFGITILEANARGVPVVGAKGTGVESAIKDGYNGILVTAGDTNELLLAISLILKDYEGFSSRALQWADAHKWDKLANQYEVLFD